MIRNGKNCGIVTSEVQTKGKGQRGNKWISKKGNIFISIFFKINSKISLKKLTKKNLSILKNIISKQVKNNIKVKLPNDILIDKKKVCGILQEVIKNGKLNYLIIGIGINLISNPKIKGSKIGNIFTETGTKIKKKLIIKRIISLYEKFFLQINNYNFQYYKKKANYLSQK